MENDSIENLITKIKARLERDTRINLHQSPINVEMHNHDIILTGEVSNIAEKRAAVDSAIRSIYHFDHWRIVDNIDVIPTDHIENLELKENVILALSEEPAFKNYTLITKIDTTAETIRDKESENRAITATIDDGRITLSGTIESLSHRRLAEVLMWWTDGCRYVDNRLVVAPPEEDTDYELNDAVRIVLEKDPLVHASQLLVNPNVA